MLPPHDPKVLTSCCAAFPYHAASVGCALVQLWSVGAVRQQDTWSMPPSGAEAAAQPRSTRPFATCE
eukprot:365682-Chlamydomonas_euryale.AAC.9